MSKQESWTVRYQKLRELGKGGNARVYLVKRSDRSEEYALKTLNARGAEKQSRFIDEIHVMRDNYATIEGILPVFDYSEADFWYTMPVAEPVMNYIERNRSSIKSKRSRRRQNTAAVIPALYPIRRGSGGYSHGSRKRVLCTVSPGQHGGSS